MGAFFVCGRWWCCSAGLVCPTLQGREKSSPMVVGGDAHIAPPSTEALSYVDGPMWASAPTRLEDAFGHVVGRDAHIAPRFIGT